MTRNVDVDARELHAGDGKVLNDFLMNARLFHLVYNLLSINVNPREWIKVNIYKGVNN